MAGEGEAKRKGGIHLDFDDLLGKDDGPLQELLIQRVAEKSNDEEADAQTENHIRGLSDKDLGKKITRIRKFLGDDKKLADGGIKLSASLRKLEAEIERRSHHKDDDKCKRLKTLADESTCKGVVNDLSHSGAPPSKPGSEFSLLFCRKMENDKATKCFGEELHALNRSDSKNMREHPPFSPQLKQNKVLSSREAPFKSASHLSMNINSQIQTNCEQRGVHAYDSLPHPPDKDAFCCLTKEESSARNQFPRRSRRNNRKTVVLDLEDGGEL